MANSATQFGIIGYSSGLGAGVAGAKDGPRVLRELQLMDKLAARGIRAKDFGDISHPTPLKPQGDETLCDNAGEVFAACQALREQTRRVMTAGYTPVILGGAHACSIGSLAAMSEHFWLQGKTLGLIWIDTHPDLHTPHTSISKNIHGMSVAFLSGMVQSAQGARTDGTASFATKDIAYIGLRDVEEAERRCIKDTAIRAYTMKEIDRFGIGAVVEEAIKHVTESTDSFVVSFDIDVCDPGIAPGTGTPIRGGLSYREAHLALELLADSNRMSGFELVEYNPSLDRASRETGELAVSLIESALGASIL